jgi:hypothetical protein
MKCEHTAERSRANRRAKNSLRSEEVDGQLQPPQSLPTPLPAPAIVRLLNQLRASWVHRSFEFCFREENMPHHARVIPAVAEHGAAISWRRRQRQQRQPIC